MGIDNKNKNAQEAIIALENAYANFNLEQIISLKDFYTEAKLILQRTNNRATPEIISEVAKALHLSLLNHLKQHGFPDFENVKRTFSELKEIDTNLYVLEETLIFPDNESDTSTIILSNHNGWRIVLSE